MESKTEQATVNKELRRLNAAVAKAMKDSSGEQMQAMTILLSDVRRGLNEIARSSQIRARVDIYSCTEQNSGDLNEIGCLPSEPERLATLTQEKRSRTREMWQQAIARGYQYRQAALDKVGPMLTPSQVAGRLGVTGATVNNWRKQNKLLGLRFDDHQYVYPEWQFVNSPALGERGVLRHLDEILIILGEIHPWDKARFFLTKLPALRGRSPLEILKEGDRQEIERVRTVAMHRAELDV